MELVSMEMPEKEVMDKGEETMSYETSSNPWPYGLQLRFEKEQIEVLPELEDYKVGDIIKISAEACVTSVRKVEGRKSSEQTIEMQIEKIACEPFKKKPMEHMTPKEYKAARMEK